MRLPSASLVIIGAACWLMNSAWAEDRVPVPAPPNLGYPAGSEIAFEWVYSCRTRSCVFTCSGPVGSTNNVTALHIYLGTTPIGNNQKYPAIFYFYSTAVVPSNSGFRISGGIQSTLACDVVG